MSLKSRSRVDGLLTCGVNFDRWSYGSNRVQIDADIKLLSEFLSVLQADSVRGYAPISSLAPAHAPSQPSRTLFMMIAELSTLTEYIACRLRRPPEASLCALEITSGERGLPLDGMEQSRQ